MSAELESLQEQTFGRATRATAGSYPAGHIVVIIEGPAASVLSYAANPWPA